MSILVGCNDRIHESSCIIEKHYILADTTHTQHIYYILALYLIYIYIYIEDLLLLIRKINSNNKKKTNTTEQTQTGYC